MLQNSFKISNTLNFLVFFLPVCRFRFDRCHCYANLRINIDLWICTGNAEDIFITKGTPIAADQKENEYVN